MYVCMLYTSGCHGIRIGTPVLQLHFGTCHCCKRSPPWIPQKDHLLSLRTTRKLLSTTRRPLGYHQDATGMPGCHWDASRLQRFKTGHSNINRACTCADLRAIPSNPLQDFSQASLITKSIKNRLWWTPVRGAQHEDHFLT